MNTPDAEQEILVFKTNICSKKDYEQIKPNLDSISSINNWSIDQDDCDNVLRIVSEVKGKSDYFISCVTSLGFKCERLM